MERLPRELPPRVAGGRRGHGGQGGEGCCKTAASQGCRGGGRGHGLDGGALQGGASVQARLSLQNLHPPVMASTVQTTSLAQLAPAPAMPLLTRVEVPAEEQCGALPTQLACHVGICHRLLYQLVRLLQPRQGSRAGGERGHRHAQKCVSWQASRHLWQNPSTIKLDPQGQACASLCPRLHCSSVATSPPCPVLQGVCCASQPTHGPPRAGPGDCAATASRPCMVRLLMPITAPQTPQAPA